MRLSIVPLRPASMPTPAETGRTSIVSATPAAHHDSHLDSLRDRFARAARVAATRGRACATAACLALAAMLAPGAADAAEVVSVARLDITRYAGEWHEIARLPMFFQRNCARNTTARYTLREDGMVGVHNRCENRDGEVDEVEGVARRVPGQEGRLEVRFAPDWLSWLPLTWADYWVIALDAEYQWAVVGDPDHEHLWILSRTPEMSRERLEDLKALATAMGYDLAPLIVSAPIR